VHAKMITFDYHVLEIMAGLHRVPVYTRETDHGHWTGLDPLVKFTGTCSPFELLERGR